MPEMSVVMEMPLSRSKPTRVSSELHAQCCLSTDEVQELWYNDSICSAGQSVAETVERLGKGLVSKKKLVAWVELEKSQKLVIFMGATGNKAKFGASIMLEALLAARTAEAAVTFTVTPSRGWHSRSDRPVPARVSPRSSRAGDKQGFHGPPWWSCDFRKAVFMGAKSLLKLQGSHQGEV